MAIVPAFTRAGLLLATAAWIATVPNAVVLKQFLAAPAAGHGAGAALFVFGGWLFVATVTLLLLAVSSLPFPGRSVKVPCIALLVLAAAASFFSTFLGTQFDRSMAANIAQTHVAEAMELLSWRLAAWVAAVGVLPAVVVYRATLRPLPALRTVERLALALALLASATCAIVFGQYARYASAGRNRDITFATVAPANLLAAAIALAASEYRTRATRLPRGVDSHQGYAIPRARLLVFVLGETTRAQDFGLNGYLRDTTPRMRAARGFYFPDTESCGTATAISVPCIFSGLTRQEFSVLRARDNETLIDVVARSGARVIWRDNDAGCKDVCGRAEYVDLTGSNDPRWCPEPAECHDGILLEGLEAALREQVRDTLLVLHLKGSHGPAYYKRYPPAFELFTPVCRTSDLASCDAAELRNAYDNTVLYTDHMVGEAIALAQRLSDRFASAVLYVSDHGESLGEKGLYLHGMPYAVAPAEQTRVPLYAWVSPPFLALERWDRACMERQTHVPRSHDNVYATVLGFLEIETREYQPALDLFEPCDPPRGGAQDSKHPGPGGTAARAH